jgi:hypothetical protein
VPRRSRKRVWGVADCNSLPPQPSPVGVCPIQNNSGLPQGPADPFPARLLMRQTACARRAPSWYDRRRHPGRELHVRHEAARVRQPARRCCNGLAARGACAASRTRAARRRPDAARRGRSTIVTPPDGVRAGTAAVGLDRRSQRADRRALGRGATPIAFGDTRRNWLHLRRTSSWPLPSRL